ncbi:hypothetical protein [Teredinibacter turnerae]|uniref:hypothetical protein n=1 Tax=Teredinibacter turnerae TaxID=2426 RepID=UPI0003A0BF55|nr:hypothetical protein [Teredinibacter turnerae]
MAGSLPNPSFYIKVEAVNIYNHIADTNQLSIIRGGGLLLKQAIDDISDHFSLKTITSGASQGVFLAEKTNSAADICTWLNRHEQYKHFTFVVDAVTANNFIDAKEKLIALGRLRQMRQLSLSPDYINGDILGPSDFGGVRVATKQIQLQNQNQLAAEIDDVRAKFGKNKRRELYQAELLRAREHLNAPYEQRLIGDGFTVTHSLNRLAHCDAMGNLNHKLAVIYFDGNGFSKIQNDTVKSDADQIEFDALMQNSRSLFMYELVSLYEKAGRGNERYFYHQKANNNDGEEYQARFETLLWGGDEMILVVPAWLGLDVLHFFYQCSADWAFRGKPLYHAGGIVFCHYKTPIFHIVDLARNLADNVKAHPQGRSNNYYDYMVLESVDYPTTSLSSFFTKTYGDHTARTRVFLPSLNSSASRQEGAEGVDEASSWTSLQSRLRSTLPELPRSQFYALVKGVRQKLTQLDSAERSQDKLNKEASDTTDAALLRSVIDEFEKRLAQLWRFSSEELKEEFENITEMLFTAPFNEADTSTLSNSSTESQQHDVAFSNTMTHFWRYLHMLELWDYLVPELRKKKAEQS